MPLKPQDLLVSLQLTLPEFAASPWTYHQLAGCLHLSDAEANAAVRRGSDAGLLTRSQGRSEKPQPVRRALIEFLEHGVRYAFYTAPGEMTRGTPTATSAQPLADVMAASADGALVWPDPEGASRGLAVEPLYPSVPAAVRTNPELHELLALVDAVRVGRARERALAIKELRARLGTDG